MKRFASTFFLLLTSVFIHSTVIAQTKLWTALFNGKSLEGWNTYIGPPLDDAGKMLSQQPVGLNTDPNGVFTIVKQDGDNVIRISGENWAACIQKTITRIFICSCSLNGGN